MNTHLTRTGWIIAVLSLALGACGATANESSEPTDDTEADNAESELAAAAADARCNAAGLHWKTANKTNYTSYPAPNSEECREYNGCEYEGLFAACSSKRSKAWVKAHNIVSVFPHFNSLKLHDLCLKKGNKTIVATVLDECADSDCSGCCTHNRGNKDELIDLESYTDDRFGVGDGAIQWADLGPTKGKGCK